MKEFRFAVVARSPDGAFESMATRWCDTATFAAGTPTPPLLGAESALAGGALPPCAPPSPLPVPPLSCEPPPERFGRRSIDGTSGAPLVRPPGPRTIGSFAGSLTWRRGRQWLERLPSGA